MDYIRQLGPVVLDHRFRRLTETLLKSADEIYAATNLTFRARWASTYMILRDEGPTAIGELAVRLKLTHPGIIGITNEMTEAGVTSAGRDKTDGRRRILALTPKGRAMSDKLARVWDAMATVQAKRFSSAGCDIIAVINAVEDGFVAKSLSTEVVERVSRSSKQTGTKRPRAGTRAARVLAGIVFAVAMTVAPSQAAAQTPITAAERAQLVKAISDSMINGYIYEATARTMADSLNAELRRGSYDSFTSGDALARRITETLRKVSNDRHLGVQYGNPGRAPASGPQRRMVRVPGNAAPPGATPVATAPALEYGFAKTEILPGNIGYIDIRGFNGDPAALRVVDSVMAIVAGVDALIIDIGRNSGGGPSVIQHLSAYLFDKRTHLVSSIRRGMNAPSERWTSENVPGKRLPKIPVYLLTSRRTFSAAESFAFGLRNNDRVTIVGEPTGGGGHFGAFVQLTSGFQMFLPQGRTYNPRTNKGWEAEGLKPDVEVPYEGALAKALELARK
jgi:DNA-binding MarR family transcriptional regulator